MKNNTLARHRPRGRSLPASLALTCAVTLVAGPGPFGQEVVLVGQGSSMRYRANAANSGLGASWVARAFDDSGAPWQSGTYGVGYEEDGPPAGMIETAVPIGTLSVYTRSRFTLASLDGIETLHVGLDYDDAAAVWLNGFEVLRLNLLGGALEWNTPPLENHESSNAASAEFDPVVDLTAIGLPRLVEGENVLAVGVWNVDSGSSDLALVPLLSINRPGPIAGTDVCGTLAGETTLARAQSPYTVSCSVVVPRGATLTIEAGVEIYFDPGTELQVTGRLLARGTAGAPIRLTRRQTGDWAGIDIDYEDDGVSRESLLCFVELSEASTLLDVQDTGDSRILVEDCDFDNWSSHALDYDEANGLEVRRCEFGLDTPPENQDSETLHGYASSALIEYCTFGPRRGYNDVVDITDTSWGGPVPTVQYNTFLGGDDDAIDLDQTAGWIIGNVVSGFWLRPGAGGEANGGGITGTNSDPVVANNIVYGCYHGIGFKDSDPGIGGPLVVNNLVVDCHVGLTFYEAECGAGRPHVLLYNNVVWDNYYTEGPRTGQNSSVVLNGTWYDEYCQDPADQATIEMRYSIVEGGWPGAGNLDADPLLADLGGGGGAGGFALLPGSPAIDSAFGGPLPAKPGMDPALLARVLEFDQARASREDPSCIANSGTGAVAYVDRGPREAPSRYCDPPGTPRFLRGDGNDDRAIDISDAVASLFVLFAAAPTDCRDALDANDDGRHDLTDVLYVLDLLYQAGPLPPAPFPAAGTDPTADGLTDCTRDPA